jgi:di/tricarboxylate transporter
VRGPLEKILRLAAREGLELDRPGSDPRLAAARAGNLAAEPAPPVADTAPAKSTSTPPAKLPLAEVVLLATSGIIGRTLREVGFAARFGTVVLALRRRGEVTDRLSTTPLHPGDVLLVEGTREALAALAETPGFLVIASPPHPEERPARLTVALLTLVGVVAVVSLGWLPVVTAATAGCAVLMLTGCLRPQEAYRAIDLSIVFLLAGSLALGTALDKTGITTALASGLAALTGSMGPFAALAGFFLVAMLLSELMSNSGTVALLGPVAVACAAELGLNPMSLLAAVTFGASTAFAMPIGYQTSLMIYGPGRYRFRDFVRVGIPLDILAMLLALWLIPRAWPLVLP